MQVMMEVVHQWNEEMHQLVGVEGWAPEAEWGTQVPL